MTAPLGELGAVVRKGTGTRDVILDSWLGIRRGGLRLVHAREREPLPNGGRHPTRLRRDRGASDATRRSSSYADQWTSTPRLSGRITARVVPGTHIFVMNDKPSAVRDAIDRIAVPKARPGVDVFK